MQVAMTREVAIATDRQAVVGHVSKTAGEFGIYIVSIVGAVVVIPSLN